MTVYVAWTPDLPEANLPGPWSELKVAAPGVLLVESDDTLSRVFHELKWALAEEAPLFVAPVFVWFIEPGRRYDTPLMAEWLAKGC